MKCGCILLLEGVVVWVSELDLHFGLGSCSGQFMVCVLGRVKLLSQCLFQPKTGTMWGRGVNETRLTSSLSSIFGFRTADKESLTTELTKLQQTYRHVKGELSAKVDQLSKSEEQVRQLTIHQSSVVRNWRTF